MNNLYKAYVYLWHLLDPDKYQYSKDIVGTHEFEEPSEHAGMSQMEDDQVQILLDMPTFDTFNELCRWAYEQGCWATFKAITPCGETSFRASSPARHGPVR